jgi:hypothetical protein
LSLNELSANSSNASSAADDRKKITKTDVGSKSGIDVALISGSVSVAASTLAIQTDETTTAGTTYVGKAAIGSATSAAAWQIFKIVDTGGNLAITWADSDALFDNIWDNRASLTYG